MSIPKRVITARPESQEELTLRAEKWLRVAGVWGRLPTRIEPLYDAAKIVERDMLELVEDSGFRKALERAEEHIKNAWQKILGIADLRKKVVYIAKGMPLARQRFTQFHEFSHQTIPWHNVNLRYKDRLRDLCAKARNTFEREASYMGSELLFQGRRFQRVARDYKVSVDSIFQLADMHKASRQATAWRLVEVQDEKIALAMYYPRDRRLAMRGSPFVFWGYVASDPLYHRFPDIQLPADLPADHPWCGAVFRGKSAGGEIKLLCGIDGNAEFVWDSWWNGFALLVLLRRRQSFPGISRIVRA